MDTGHNWEAVTTTTPRNYTCGYSGCGREVSSEKGRAHYNDGHNHYDGNIQICPVCKRPTFFDRFKNIQSPGISIGNPVGNLPPDLEVIWSEIRSSTSHAAYTSAVLLGRKLLMHIAVHVGAKSGATFVDYVDYLVNNHFAPPNSKDWIDKIRSHGNEANHEISIKKQDDAEEIMTFLEMLLKFIYEFPARAAGATVVATKKP
jgi:hypothetical protein